MGPALKLRLKKSSCTVLIVASGHEVLMSGIKPFSCHHWKRRNGYERKPTVRIIAIFLWIS